jgi:S-adenosylhomocysteine hydrolase
MTIIDINNYEQLKNTIDNLLREKEFYYYQNNNNNKIYKVRHYIKEIEDTYDLIVARNEIDAIIKLSNMSHMDDQFYLDNIGKYDISELNNQTLDKAIYDFYENDKLWLEEIIN